MSYYKIYKRIINKIIKDINIDFLKNPYEFLSESDIKCKLFEKLSRNKIFSKNEEIMTDSCWGTEKKLKFKKIKSTRLHTEYLTGRERFDLVILEPVDMETKRNSKGKIGYIRLKENKFFQVIIEIKSSRTNRNISSKSHFLNEIKNDLLKIKNFKYKLAYVLVFDYNNYLKLEDISELKKYNTRVNLFVFGI